MTHNNIIYSVFARCSVIINGCILFRIPYIVVQYYYLTPMNIKSMIVNDNIDKQTERGIMKGMRQSYDSPAI